MRHTLPRTTFWRRYYAKIGVAAAIAIFAFQSAGYASSNPFISIVSGSSGTDNLTIDSNGTTTTANTASVSFSSAGPTAGGTIYSGYDLTDHVLGTVSTPTSTGYSTTPYVSNNGSGNYAGGPVSITAPNGTVLTSTNISAFASGTTTADTGYFMYTVNFSLSAASTDPFQITGFADADNEIQDVILDYGTTSSSGTVTQTGTVLSISAVNGTEIRTTNNAASNAAFQTTAPASNLSGAHTLSFIVYNHDGPTDINFGFTALSMPEPNAFDLFAAGLPFLGVCTGVACRKGARSN